MPIQYKCLDCNHYFNEFEAVNCSLVDYEYNVGCPKCGGDHIETLSIVEQEHKL